MDALKRQILSILQEDGRISTTDLAAQVGLSLSSCHRRVRDLEQSGAIERYRAVISPEAVGLNFEALVFATMARTDVETLEAFEQAVMDEPSIVMAQRLFGDPDYMFRVFAKDLTHYQELFDTRLTAIPGVQRLTSTLVMKRLGTDHSVPLHG